MSLTAVRPSSRNIPDRHLLAYVLASGTGVLAAVPGHAAIVYSGPVNQVLFGDAAYAIDFDGDTLTDLTVSYSDDGTQWSANILGSATARVAYDSFSIATRFEAGDLINSAGKYDTGSKVLANYPLDDTVPSSGNFAANTTGFAGFRLDGDKFGWIRFAMGGPLDGSTPFAVVDWAYDTTGAIRAGATTALSSPAGDAFAAFAAGAAGLAGWRRRRQAA